MFWPRCEGGCCRRISISIWLLAMASALYDEGHPLYEYFRGIYIMRLLLGVPRPYDLSAIHSECRRQYENNSRGLRKDSRVRRRGTRTKSLPSFAAVLLDFSECVSRPVHFLAGLILSTKHQTGKMLFAASPPRG